MPLFYIQLCFRFHRKLLLWLPNPRWGDEVGFLAAAAAAAAAAAPTAYERWFLFVNMRREQPWSRKDRFREAQYGNTEPNGAMITVRTMHAEPNPTGNPGSSEEHKNLITKS